MKEIMMISMEDLKCNIKEEKTTITAKAFKYSVKSRRLEACPGSINSSIFTFDEESLLSYYKRTDHFETRARRNQDLEYP